MTLHLRTAALIFSIAGLVAFGDGKIVDAKHRVTFDGTIVRKTSREEIVASHVSRRAVMFKLAPIDQRAVRRAIDLARAKLALPGCPQVYEDFALPNGDTPQRELERMGIGPEEFLETLVFTDGSRESACRTGPAFLRTTPGSGLIRVCPGFARLQTADPGMSASLIIHESLHALGVGEDPPTSKDITRRIERRCWKLGTRDAGRVGPDAAGKSRKRG